jgi:hypothetical protein
MRRAHLAAGLAVLLLPASARAGDDALGQAKTYFSAGAQAYDAGRFSAAVQAFQQAYALAPRPAILFSMAQAERKAWFVDKRVDDLKHAIEHYHAYLSQIPTGGRRGDAADGLAELEPLASRVTQEPTAPTAPAAEAKTRMMVTSSTSGAKASLDGGPATEVPLIDDVTAGKHHVHLSADGYFDEDRDAIAAAGSLAAIDVVLREKPALLSIQLDASAAIAVDGRPIGSSPLARPLELPAGTHLVTITKNGYEAFSHEITLERGKPSSMAASLRTTGQRTTAWVFFCAGGVGLLTGAVARARHPRCQEDGQHPGQRSVRLRRGRERARPLADRLDRRLRSGRGSAGGRHVPVGLRRAEPAAGLAPAGASRPTGAAFEERRAHGDGTGPLGSSRLRGHLVR